MLPLASSLLDLYGKRERSPDFDFDCVLIEMSGLADPVPVMQILLTDRYVSALYELKTVIAVADGVHGAGQFARHTESVKQAAVADTIVISKTDIAGGGVLDALARRLAALNPGARQLRAAHGDIAAERVLAGAGFDLAGRSEAARGWLNDENYAATVAPASADPAISTFSLTYDEEITVPGLVLWLNLLAGFRGAGLLRVKGIVNVEGKPYAVQAVQTIVDEPVPLAAWPDDGRRSRLVRHAFVGGQTAYIGFTAATGGSYQESDILNWKFDTSIGGGPEAWVIDLTDNADTVSLGDLSLTRDGGPNLLPGSGAQLA